MPAKIKVPFSRRQLRSDYSRLKSTLKIARKYGVSKKYVSLKLREFEIQAVPRVAPVEEVRRLAESWLSPQEIAQKMGRTPEGINWIVRTYGIKIYKRYHSGIQKRAKGYLMAYRPDHPFCDSKGYVMIHRLVMEASLGRYLHPKEVVHHINGNPGDNRRVNLVLFSCTGDHVRHELKGKKRKPRARGGFARKARATSSDR